MRISYLFSKRDKWGSKLIAWASAKLVSDLEVVPSHMAVLLDEHTVIESTLTTGVRMIPYTHWKKINEELYSIPCIHQHRDHLEVIETAYSLWGKKYDWGGIFYFGLCLLGRIYLNKKMPTVNKWQDKNKYFCNEFAGKLTGEDFSMKTPADVCEAWLREMK